MMSITRGVCTSLLVASALFLPQLAHAQDAKTLTGDEIRALFSGNEMTATNSRGQKFTEQYKADGTFEATSTRTDGSCCLTDDGKWSVEDNRFCRQYSNWRDGRKTCGRILKGPDGYVTQSGLKMKFKRE